MFPSNACPSAAGWSGVAVQTQAPVYAPDVRRDARYHMVNPLTRSELAVPLIYKKKVIGVLDLEHTRANYFNEDHQRTIVTLAAQIAIAIENARLYQRVAQQEQRLEHDLEMAREVQLRLLPQARPKHQYAEFASRFLPARTIGGDMYDFLHYDNYRTGIALGDASGKAAPAALYAALVSGIMRAAAPRACIRKRCCGCSTIRCRSGAWTRNTSRWCTQCGTMKTRRWRSRTPARCSRSSAATAKWRRSTLRASLSGLFPDVSYEQFTLSLRPGDSVVFFSDGLADAQNPEADMFGTEQLCEMVQQNASLACE